MLIANVIDDGNSIPDRNSFQKPLLWCRVHLKVDIGRHIYVKTWFQLILLWSMAKKIYQVWFILGGWPLYRCWHLICSIQSETYSTLYRVSQWNVSFCITDKLCMTWKILIYFHPFICICFQVLLRICCLSHVFYIPLCGHWSWPSNSRDRLKTLIPWACPSVAKLSAKSFKHV